MQESKKVLMVSCDGFGKAGVQAVIMAIVRNLHEQVKFDALLFTDEVRYYEEEFLSYGGKIFRIPLLQSNNGLVRKFLYFYNKIKIYKNVCKLLKSNPPYDAIHCNNNFDSFLCAKAAKKHGIPVRVIHSHVTTVSGEKRVLDFLNSYQTRQIIKYGTHFIGCSKAACETLFGNNSSWQIINNPYDEKEFVTDRYTIIDDKEDKINLIQVGSFSDNKNQIFSLRVLKSILELNQKASLSFLGFGDYIKNIEEEAEKLGVSEHIAFLPHDSDIPFHLSQSHAFLFPSKIEGFGIAVIEAQAMGVPCYVSDTVPRSTNVGGCTYLSLNDPSRWASCIVEDYKNNKRTCQGYNCEQFSTSNVVKVYKKIYTGE